MVSDGYSPRCDSIGLMGKSTWDIATALQAIYKGPKEEFLQFAENPEPLHKFRIGCGEFVPLDPNSGSVNQAKKMWDQCIDIIKPALVLQDMTFAHADWLGEQVEFDNGVGVATRCKYLYLTDVYTGINNYLSTLKGCQVQNVQELIEWKPSHPVSKYWDKS